jgi:hypothetical protein
LAFDGHDIGVARQHDAAVDLRADRRKQRHLVTFGVGHLHVLDAEFREIGFDVGRQREIGLGALGIEGDETFENSQRLGQPPIRRARGKRRHSMFQPYASPA